MRSNPTASSLAPLPAALSKHRLSVMALLLTLGWPCGPLFGDDHAAPRWPAPPKPRPCLLLHNGNVLFGEVSTVGRITYVTRDDDSVIQLAADQVAAVGESVADLYEHRRANRFGGDLRRIQDDIRWCLRHSLVREAAEDALLARSLAPGDPQTAQLLRQIAHRLQSQRDNETRAREESEPSLPWDRLSAVQPASHEAPLAVEESDENASSNDSFPIDQASINQFTTRIQPMLMNRCASCHTRKPESPGGLQLHAAITSTWAPKRVAADNLRSVLKFINLNDPAASQLRSSAMDHHGGRKKSFGDASSAMMQNLDEWLSRLRPSDAEPVQDASASGPLEPTAPPELSTLQSPVPVNSGSSTSSAMSPNAGDSVIPHPPPSIASQAKASIQAAGSKIRRVRRMPEVDNPFDPNIFNRRFR